MRKRPLLIALSIALTLGGCASVHNVPLNKPSATPFAGTMVQAAAAATAAAQKGPANHDDIVVGVALSGGGTRAAAFGHGVLGELARTPLPRGARGDLFDRVNILSGVSGGSVAAAYYGLKGRTALGDFREKFLVQDVMATLNTQVSVVNIGRALGGGLNTDNRLRDWFNANLFDDATFGTLIGRGRPMVLINATDVYNRTPFLFAPPTFAALCSDVTEYPVAGAVAASAAVPGVFAPIIIEPFPGTCDTPLPEPIVRAAKNPGGSPQLYAFAKALENARSGKQKYIKLFDGGLVDNFGLSGVTIARAVSGSAYAPLRPQEAVAMRRMLFVVVDSGIDPQGGWSQTLEGPSGKELVGAVISAIMDSNTRSSYAAFESTMQSWRNDLIRWRCGLKPAEVAQLRGTAGRWNCRDLKFTIARVSFAQLGDARAAKLNAVPTSFTLPAATVDEVVQAGADALQENSAFQAFLKDM